MFMGVPMIPFLLVTGLFSILAMWSFYLFSPYAALIVLLIYAPIYFFMRQLTKKDDQRLRQIMLQARMRLRHSNQQIWGAISYSPIRYKKRS